MLAQPYQKGDAPQYAIECQTAGFPVCLCGAADRSPQVARATTPPTRPQRRHPSRGSIPHPKKVDTKTHEIPCVRPVFDDLEIEGKVITADARLT